MYSTDVDYKNANSWNSQLKIVCIERNLFVSLLINVTDM